jgi:ribosome biogenesis protein ENP2
MQNIKLASILEDDRFKDAFANPEFEIDEETVEYSQINPSRSVVRIHQF